MSGYQFLRMATYAMAVPKLHVRAQEQRRELGKEQVERKLSVEEICFEAGRVPGNHPHVVAAEAPTLLFGMAPEAIPQWLQEKIDEKNKAIAAIKRGLPRRQRRSGPRAIRKDTPVLIGIVGSHPYLIKSDGTDYPSMEDPENRREVEKWAEDWVAWKLADAAARGTTVLSILAHTDEAHYHLHALEMANGLRLEAREGHPGYFAKRSIPFIEGESPKDYAARGNYAYREAMTGWQDEHHRIVSVPHGLLRIGPGRRRLTRPQYQEEKKAAKGLARARALEEAERLRGEAAAAEREAESSRVQAELDQLKSDVQSLELQAEVAESEAEKAEQLRTERVRAGEEVLSRVADTVIDASERKREVERAAALEEERLSRLREMCASEERSLERAQSARAVAEEAGAAAAAERDAADQARETSVSRARQEADTLRLMMEANAAADEALKNKSDEKNRLTAEVAALTEAAEENRKLVAARDAALAVAEAAYERRAHDLLERETSFEAREMLHREREVELDAKLEGIEAFADGRLVILDKDEGPKLDFPSGDEALRAKIRPVAGWLRTRLLPLHRARSLALALAETARAWAKGIILGVDRRKVTNGGPAIVGDPRMLSPEVFQAIVLNRSAVADLLDPLPNLHQLAQLADDAEVLRAHLPAAASAKASSLAAAVDDLDWPPHVRRKGAGIGD